MSHGLLVILRYFLLVLLWLFFLYASRMVIVDVRRSRNDDESRARNRAARGGMRLRVLEPKDRRGEVIDLDDEVTFGRSPACVVTLEDDTFVSTVHARVFVRDGRPYVEDLGSTNGTFVNEARIGQSTPLERGDLLRVGGTVLELRR